MKNSLFKSIFIGILIYVIILLIAAFLFQQSGELCISNKNVTATSFQDCLYFSVITFHTIGYGDIIPNGELAQILVMVLSFFSFVYVTIFPGLFVYYLIKRNEAKGRVNLKYIAYSNLLQITEKFSSKFPIYSLLEVKPSYIYFGEKHYVFLPFLLKEHIDIKSSAITAILSYSVTNYEDEMEHMQKYYSNLDAYLNQYENYLESEFIDEVHEIKYRTDVFIRTGEMALKIEPREPLFEGMNISISIGRILEDSLELQKKLILGSTKIEPLVITTSGFQSDE